MRRPVETLDDFLEGPHQRALTRVIRKRLAQGRSLTLAFGHGSTAERFVATLARTFPHQHVLLALIEAEPLRVTMEPQTSAPRVREAPGASGEQLVRALLRQDPDALAVPRLDGVDPAVLVNALLTGHQLLLGVDAPSLEAALAATCAGAAGLEDVVRQSLDAVCELDERGRLRRVWATEGPGGLVEVARVEGGAVVVDPRALAPRAPEPESEPVGPVLAPTLEVRPKATRAPRAVFLPVVSAAPGRSLLGTPRAHRPRGSTWPSCGGCGGPLALIVQLDLAALPPPLTVEGGLAQLFLCTQGTCDVEHERSPGVLA
ncbi:MAG: hypothetical protein INH37_15615, partial [Myxococcaceae bacterium]|nr:hypothetical protein [Myxococcaceae bacterium]